MATAPKSLQEANKDRPLLLGKEVLGPALVVGLHLALSGFYLYQLLDTGLFDLNLQDRHDTFSYHRWAIEAAKGNLSEVVQHTQYALYILAAGVIYALFGVNPALISLFQILLSAAACLLLYDLGRRIFSPGVGLLAAGLYAVYPVSIYYTGFILRETLITFLGLLLVYVLVLALEKRRPLFYVLAGIVCVLAVAGRFNVVLFAAAFSWWAFFFHFRVLGRFDSTFPATKIGAGLTLALAGALLVIAMPNLVTSWWWVVGNSYDSTMFIYTPTGDVIPTFSLDFLLRQFYKAFLFFNNFEAPNNFNFYLFKERLSLLRFLPLSFGVIFPFAVIGFIWGLRNTKPIMPVLLFVACQAATVIPLYITSRWRLPIVPFVILMASYGIYLLALRVRERKHRLLAVQLSLLIVMILFTFFKPQHVRQAEMTMRAAQRVGFSYLYMGKGQAERAVAELRQAHEEVPSYKSAYVNLGYLLFQQRRYADALAVYDTALTLGPDPGLCFSRGLALMELNRPEEAEKSFRECVALDSGNWQAFMNLAKIAFLRNQQEEAFGLCDKVLSLNPGLAAAWSLRAETLLRLGRLEEAEKSVIRAIEREPHDPSHYNSLGTVLAMRGAYEKAAAAYLEAVARNPELASAHLNLAAIYVNHLNDRKRAAPHIRRFLDLSPAYPERKGLEQLLHEIEGGG